MLWILGVFTVVPMTVGAQPLSSADAVERALAHCGMDAVAMASDAAHAARVEVDTVADVPRAFAAFEAVNGQAGAVEVTLGASHRFDLTGWRDRHRALAHRWAEADAAHRDAIRLEIATEVRRVFWAARASEDRLAAYDAQIAVVERGLDTLRARYAQGDVARYAVVRVERERDGLVAERLVVQAERDAAAAGVRAITGAEVGVALVGRLRPDQPGRLAEGPLVQAGEALAAGWDAAADNTDRPALRGWEVEAGYRVARAAGSTGHGASVAISVPLGGRVSADVVRERASAEAALARAERDRAMHVVHHDRATARGRLQVALDALSVLEERDADELVALAEAAWAAGEAPLADVVDAWRSEAERVLLRIELEWAARDAAIDLLATGELEVP